MNAKEMAERAQDSGSLFISDMTALRDHLRKEVNAGCIAVEEAIEDAEKASALLAKLHGYVWGK